MALYITNFSIPEDSTVYCTSLVDFSVDITDDTHMVTLSGTYMTDNGATVPYIITPISDGYTLTYSTVPSGTMLLEVFGSNSNDEYISTVFILQYGYELTWDKVVKWPLNKEIPISVTATNDVLNANTAYFSTFFKTTTYKESSLEALISVEGSGQYNMLAEVKPQSKYFMYGKTYSVTISGVKDFSGNILPAKTFTFSLENAPQ